jgi:hypothetical protein
VSGEKWGDDEVPVPYQEITRAYVHAPEGGGREMWVRVEFKPWVGFLEGVDDEDQDGFPEIYGRVPGEVLTAGILEELARYRGEVLTRDEAIGSRESGEEDGWAFELCSQLYPRYNTEKLDPKQLAAFPDEKAKAIVGDELDRLGGARPNLVIAARPFEKNLYNVFLIEGFAEP